MSEPTTEADGHLSVKRPAFLSSDPIWERTVLAIEAEVRADLAAKLGKSGRIVRVTFDRICGFRDAVAAVLAEMKEARTSETR